MKMANRLTHFKTDFISTNYQISYVKCRLLKEQWFYAASLSVYYVSKVLQLFLKADTPNFKLKSFPEIKTASKSLRIFAASNKD